MECPLTIETSVGVLSDLESTLHRRRVEQVPHLLIVDLEHAQYHLKLDVGAGLALNAFEQLLTSDWNNTYRDEDMQEVPCSVQWKVVQ